MNLREIYICKEPIALSKLSDGTISKSSVEGDEFQLAGIGPFQDPTTPEILLVHNKTNHTKYVTKKDFDKFFYKNEVSEPALARDLTPMPLDRQVYTQFPIVQNFYNAVEQKPLLKTVQKKEIPSEHQNHILTAQLINSVTFLIIILITTIILSTTFLFFAFVTSGK